jgi:hypothetical protein
VALRGLEDGMYQVECALSLPPEEAAEWGSTGARTHDDDLRGGCIGVGDGSLTDAKLSMKGG